MATSFTYLSLFLAFFITYVSLPNWIKVAKKFGFTGEDINKVSKKQIPEAGGLCVILGFVVSYFVYLGSLVFLSDIEPSKILFAFAAVCTIILAAFTGFIDDILGWKLGFTRWYKLLLTMVIPLPIMVINAGQSVMNVPFLGLFDFGLVFPLILVPLAIIGSSNGFNMLAGFNGLEAGQGIIILSTLGVISYLQGSYPIAVLCLIISVSLLAFLFFNFYPAKAFPGDTLTYSIGATIGVVAILANAEKFGLILFIPYFIELILKIRGKLKKESFGKPLKNLVKNRYDKNYSLTHLGIYLLGGRAKEYNVVFLIWSFEMICASIALLSYFKVLPL